LLCYSLLERSSLSMDRAGAWWRAFCRPNHRTDENHLPDLLNAVLIVIF
jgi:hypothetical protein